MDLRLGNIAEEEQALNMIIGRQTKRDLCGTKRKLESKRHIFRFIKGLTVDMEVRSPMRS
jgi:hypothetical protein